MQKQSYLRLLIPAVFFLVLWIFFRWIMPIALPFLLGLGIALAAEPAVNFAVRRVRLPRRAAVGLGVSLTLILGSGLAAAAAALLMRQLAALAEAVPDLHSAVRQGLGLLQDRLLELAGRMPEGIRPVIRAGISSFFAGGTLFLDRVSRWLWQLAASLLHALPDSALGIAATVLSAYMICARLPQLRLLCAGRRQYLPVLTQLKAIVLGWLKAQGRLAGVTFLLVTGGLLLLKIPAGPLWGLLIAAVDAVPLLGTGTVLIPWAAVCFFRREQGRALGLLGLYAAAALTRSYLEPRFLGKDLGLDPLAALAALYTGYRLFGVGGMILAPLATVLAVKLGDFGGEK